MFVVQLVLDFSSMAKRERPHKKVRMRGVDPDASRSSNVLPFDGRGSFPRGNQLATPELSESILPSSPLIVQGQSLDAPAGGEIEEGKDTDKCMQTRGNEENSAGSSLSYDRVSRSPQPPIAHVTAPESSASDNPKHLSLHEKTKLLRICCKHGSKLLECPTSGKHAEEEFWKLVLEEFSNTVRVGVFKSYSEVKKANNKISKSRRKRTDNADLSTRRSRLGDHDMWIGRWEKISACRDLIISLANLHQVARGALGEKRLKRIFRDRIDGNELPQDLGMLTLSPPLWKAMQKRIRAIGRPERRRRWSVLTNGTESDLTEEDGMDEDDPSAETVDETPLESIEEEFQEEELQEESLFVTPDPKTSTSGWGLGLRSPSPGTQGKLDRLEQETITMLKEAKSRLQDEHISILGLAQRNLEREQPSPPRTSLPDMEDVPLSDITQPQLEAIELRDPQFPVPTPDSDSIPSNEVPIRRNMSTGSTRSQRLPIGTYAPGVSVFLGWHPRQLSLVGDNDTAERDFRQGAFATISICGQINIRLRTFNMQGGAVPSAYRLHNVSSVSHKDVIYHPAFHRMTYNEMRSEVASRSRIADGQRVLMHWVRTPIAIANHNNRNEMGAASLSASVSSNDGSYNSAVSSLENEETGGMVDAEGSEHGNSVALTSISTSTSQASTSRGDSNERGAQNREIVEETIQVALERDMGEIETTMSATRGRQISARPTRETADYPSPPSSQEIPEVAQEMSDPSTIQRCTLKIQTNSKTDVTPSNTRISPSVSRGEDSLNQVKSEVEVQEIVNPFPRSDLTQRLTTPLSSYSWTRFNPFEDSDSDEFPEVEELYRRNAKFPRRVSDLSHHSPQDQEGNDHVDIEMIQGESAIQERSQSDEADHGSSQVSTVQNQISDHEHLQKPGTNLHPESSSGEQSTKKNTKTRASRSRSRKRTREQSSVISNVSVSVSGDTEQNSTMEIIEVEPDVPTDNSRPSKRQKQPSPSETRASTVPVSSEEAQSLRILSTQSTRPLTPPGEVVTGSELEHREDITMHTDNEDTTLPQSEGEDSRWDSGSSLARDSQAPNHKTSKRAVSFHHQASDDQTASQNKSTQAKALERPKSRHRHGGRHKSGTNNSNPSSSKKPTSTTQEGSTTETPKSKKKNRKKQKQRQNQFQDQNPSQTNKSSNSSRFLRERTIDFDSFSNERKLNFLLTKVSLLQETVGKMHQ
ncbi:hypothetical protein M426DRAFT_239008 [Hypoxylon sp. CI-4A]|nr:hypothetical protein M426DRAFT_239008 [Hypoxylon sp. CI-4A]